MSDKSRVGRAFRALKRLGYSTQAGKWCCGSCASSSFDHDKFVFYHRQSMDAFDEFGDIKDGAKLYLGHGQDGDGYEIMRALNDQGLIVQWDGSLNTTLMVLHNDRVNYTHPEVA